MSKFNKILDPISGLSYTLMIRELLIYYKNTRISREELSVLTTIFLNSENTSF